jgi:hypothetical protein
MRTLLFLSIFSLAGGAIAQSDGDATRGSTPPGMSQDGARPAEGALKGGTLAPGESGGSPQEDPAKAGETTDGAAKSGTEGAAAGGTAKALERCYELEGTLREQCLADHASKAGAEPRAPSAVPPRRD